MKGVGAHEIIVETPRHDRSLHELEVHEISDVIRAYTARITDLEGDKRMCFVLIFKNHGEGAGIHDSQKKHVCGLLPRRTIMPGYGNHSKTAAQRWREAEDFGTARANLFCNGSSDSGR